jgi:UDP-glucuronate decarboxylase
MKHALITGGAGFLGSHLAKSLLSDGYSVTVLDNLMTGSIENLTGIRDKIKFIHHDIIDPYDIEADEYWNLACCASPPKYQKDPIHTFKTSIWGIENALINATKYGGIVFQASTSEVYGDPTVSPQPETYWGNVNPVGIRSNYDEGKRAAETLMTDWSKQHGTQIRIARIFNTYGPNLDKDDGRVVTNFINQALRGEDLTIYGDGKQTRSFCYVSDLIAGFRKLIDSNVQTPVNLGNPGEFTMLELAEKVLKKTGSKSKLVYMPLPGDDPKQRCPDITKAETLLGWKPSVSLDEGLDKTIAYFRM